MMSALQAGRLEAARQCCSSPATSSALPTEGIGLEHADYRISYYTSQEQLAGEHVLEAEGIYVRISPERFGEPGLAWRNPFWKPPGAVMRKAPITALADIPALTARIARELKIAPPAQPGLI